MKRNDQERKQREKLIGKLQESNNANEMLIKLRRKLIQNVTHELRTPLTAISGNAELLLNDTEADSRMRHAQTIHNAAGRMAGMIITTSWCVSVCTAARKRQASSSSSYAPSPRP